MEVMPYPLYDALVERTKEDGFDKNYSEEILSNTLQTLKLLSKADRRAHNLELFGIIFHHHILEGNTPSFGAKNFCYDSRSIDRQNRGFIFYLSELPIELKKILFAYITYFK